MIIVFGNSPNSCHMCSIIYIYLQACLRSTAQIAVTRRSFIYVTPASKPVFNSMNSCHMLHACTCSLLADDAHMHHLLGLEVFLLKEVTQFPYRGNASHRSYLAVQLASL